MEVVQDDLWLCDDCMIAAVNGDFTGMDDAAEKRVLKGLEDLGPNLVPDFDSETGEGTQEFSHMTCDCCGSRLGGGRHRFAVLGEEKKRGLGSGGKETLFLTHGSIRNEWQLKDSRDAYIGTFKTLDEAKKFATEGNYRLQIIEGKKISWFGGHRAMKAKAPFEFNVSSKYGAPMGRTSTPLKELVGAVQLRQVKMYDGAYDKGGAYWGGGTPLFCAFDDEGNAHYFRANSMAEAKKIVDAALPRVG